MGYNCEYNVASNYDKKFVFGAMKLYHHIMTNKNSRIKSRVDARGNNRTETKGRDFGPDFAVSTTKSGKTRAFIDYDEFTVKLNGHELRTLYRMLKKHYTFLGTEDTL